MTNEQKSRSIEQQAKGMSCSKIGQLLTISDNTVRSFCLRNALASNTAALCRQCGASIPAGKYKRERKFCSVECRNRWRNAHLDQVNRKAYYTMICQHCEQSFESYGNKNRKFCSRDCYIAHRYGNGESHG